MEETKVYRMHRYGAKAWEIQLKKIAGENAKEPGAVSWVSVAYPGTMIQAAHWLLDAHFDGSNGFESLDLVEARLEEIAAILAEFYSVHEDAEINIRGM